MRQTIIASASVLLLISLCYAVPERRPAERKSKMVLPRPSVDNNDCGKLNRKELANQNSWIASVRKVPLRMWEATGFPQSLSFYLCHGVIFHSRGVLLTRDCIGQFDINEIVFYINKRLHLPRAIFRSPTETHDPSNLAIIILTEEVDLGENVKLISLPDHGTRFDKCGCVAISVRRSFNTHVIHDAECWNKKSLICTKRVKKQTCIDTFALVCPRRSHKSEPVLAAVNKRIGFEKQYSTHSPREHCIEVFENIADQREWIDYTMKKAFKGRPYFCHPMATQSQNGTVHALDHATDTITKKGITGQVRRNKDSQPLSESQTVDNSSPRGRKIGDNCGRLNRTMLRDSKKVVAKVFEIAYGRRDHVCDGAIIHSRGVLISLDCSKKIVLSEVQVEIQNKIVGVDTMLRAPDRDAANVAIIILIPKVSFQLIFLPEQGALFNGCGCAAIGVEDHYGTHAVTNRNKCSNVTNSICTQNFNPYSCTKTFGLVCPMGIDNPRPVLAAVHKLSSTSSYEGDPPILECADTFENIVIQREWLDLVLQALDGPDSKRWRRPELRTTTLIGYATLSGTNPYYI